MGWKDTIQEAKSSWKDTIKEEPEVQEPERTEKYSQLDAALQGLGQGVSFSLNDELSGLVGAALNPEGSPGKGISGYFTEFPERYREARDVAREELEGAKEAHPNIYTAGEIGGGLATMKIPLGALGKASQATSAARIGRAGTEGALYGLGGSEADLTKGEVGDVLGDTAKGAGFGLGFGAGGELLSHYGSKFAKPEAYNELEKKVVSQKLKISPSDYSKIERQPVRLPNGETSTVAENLPTFLKGEGFHPLSTFEGMQNKLYSVKNEAMSGINQVAKEFDSEMARMTEAVHTPPSAPGQPHTLKIPVEAISTADKIAYRPAESFVPKVNEILEGIRGVPGYSGQTNKIVKLTEELKTLAGEEGISSLEKLQSVRQRIDALIKDHTQSSFKMSAYEEALTTLRRDIAEHIRDKMLPEFDKLRGSNFESLRNTLLENNYKYAMAASAEDLLNKGAGREAKNRVMSLTDLIVGAGGLAHSGPIGAGAAYLGKKGMELAGQTAGLYAPEIAKYTPIKQASSLVGMAGKGVLKSNPAVSQQVTEQTGTQSYEQMKSDPQYGQLLQDPKRAPLNHYLLMQKDEEYRKRILGGQK